MGTVFLFCWQRTDFTPLQGVKLSKGHLVLFLTIMWIQGQSSSQEQKGLLEGKVQAVHVLLQQLGGT